MQRPVATLLQIWQRYGPLDRDNCPILTAREAESNNLDHTSAICNCMQVSNNETKHCDHRAGLEVMPPIRLSHCGAFTAQVAAKCPSCPSRSPSLDGQEHQHIRSAYSR